MKCLVWRSHLYHPDVLENLLTLQGRGFIAGDSVYIPVQWAIYPILLRNGRLDEQGQYPRKGDWADGQGPGNLLVSGDHVIVAGQDQVDVYTDLSLAQAKLDAETAASPADPEPRLRYAEVMFAAREMDIALKKMDEAIGLLGGADIHAARSGS